MNTLQRKLFSTIVKAFFITIIMLVFILILVEFFKQLMSYNITYKDIFLINLYYIPACIYQAMPLALLFAICFSLGNLYSNNELIAVFSSGFSLSKLVLPVIILSIFASFSSFAFSEFVVLDSTKKQNAVQDSTHPNFGGSSNVQSAIDHDNNIIYYADYFIEKAGKLRRLIIIERNDKNQLMARIDAASAQWQSEGEYWNLSEARVFTWNETGDLIEESYFPSFVSDKLRLSPKVFKEVGTDVEELHFTKAWNYLATLKATGRRKEYLEGITPLLRRLTFPFVNLIVSLFACSIGSMFKKNILIMSLGACLGLAVVYYVFQMLTVKFAQNGYMPPFIGAVLPEIVFTALGVNLFKNART